MEAEVVTETYVQKTKRCDVFGCIELTRENKPFCLEHIERAPYVQDLLRRMEERVKLDQEVETDHQKADLDSITAREIVLALRKQGTVTEENMSRAMKLPRTTIHNYALAMQDKKIVTLRPTDRGRMAVTLLDSDGKPAIPDFCDEDDEDDD